MAYIKKAEVDFLEKLYHKIEDKKKFQEEKTELFQLISNLDERNVTLNEKTRLTVNARRQKDPAYGRSKEEKERIKNTQPKKK